jgi:two-component system response regulator AtoC
VIDDEKNMRHMLKFMLEKHDYAVSCAEDGLMALGLMAQDVFDYILCDIRMPRMDGVAFLKEASEKYPEKTYIMMSAYGTVDTALEAIKMGAYDYISKPFKTDEVLLTLKKAEERERLKTENIDLKNKMEKIQNKYSFGSIVARSEAMAKVFDLVEESCRTQDHCVDHRREWYGKRVDCQINSFQWPAAQCLAGDHQLRGNSRESSRK